MEKEVETLQREVELMRMQWMGSIEQLQKDKDNAE